MAALVDLKRLGGIIPKTITREPRPGNAPWRTIETAAGMLNSIGLDNDGQEAFIEHHLPYLATVGSPIIVSIAGRNLNEFIEMARRMEDLSGVAALELNISCPNVSHGVDLGVDPEMCRRVIAGSRDACSLPIIAKLTPNVTNITDIARAAADGGADAISAINTVLGMSVVGAAGVPCWAMSWAVSAGPQSSRWHCGCVYQISRAVKTPVIGIGGIATIDDVMEFIVAGATAVQIGTANFYNPTVTMQLLDALPAAVNQLGAEICRRNRRHHQDGSTSEQKSLIMRVLSGIQPTGRFHWGNYFGASGNISICSTKMPLIISSPICMR